MFLLCKQPRQNNNKTIEAKVNIQISSTIDKYNYVIKIHIVKSKKRKINMKIKIIIDNDTLDNNLIKELLNNAKNICQTNIGCGFIAEYEN